MTTAPRPAPTLVERTQDGVLIVIVLLVGGMAGAASFNHVHDFTIANSPTGTADWFGWANAVISELIPTASLIEIGRRRRRNPAASVRYPMVLLVAAVGVSLTAQLAVAEPTVFGWLVSALPALAFFALSKLVFTVTRPTLRPALTVAAPTPATSPASSSDSPRAQVRPAAASTTRAAITEPTDTAHDAPAKEITAPAPAEPVPAEPATVDATAAAPDQEIPARLLTSARTVADSHRDRHGEPISANQMAVRLRVPTAVATDLLARLDTGPATPSTAPRNGSTVTTTA